MENPLTSPSNNKQADQSAGKQSREDFSELKALLDKDFRQREERSRQRELAVRARLRLQEDFGQLQATYRWFSWKTMFLYLLPFIAGLLMMLMGLFAAAQSPDFFVQIAPLMGLIVALWGAYMSLVTALNRTVIGISSGRICVQHGPLPYPGNRSVACVDLQQVTVAEREHKPNEPATYQLKVTLTTGENLTLWSNANRARLDYVKQAIERQLARSAAYSE